MAVSAKHKKRCIAGIRLDGNGWIRPISDADGGELGAEHYKLDKKPAPDLLDVIEIEGEPHSGKSYHPEDFRLGGSQWNFCDGLPDNAQDLIGKSLELDDALLGSVTDRVPETSSIRNSLALVKTTDLTWVVEKAWHNDKLRLRAQFTHSGRSYSLSVTDLTLDLPPWKLGEGQFPIEKCKKFKPEESAVLTISLTEPFDGNCYKLVAAAIPISEFNARGIEL